MSKFPAATMMNKNLRVNQVDIDQIQGTGKIGQVSPMGELIASYAKHIQNFKCVDMNGMTGINLKSGVHINSYRGLIDYLSDKFSQAKGLELLLKFWIGDILVQGEDILGEEFACVFGTELSGRDWSRGHVANIMWVCRNLPPEHRRLSLTWGVHRELAPSWVTPEDRAFFISKALDMSEDPEQRDHYVRDTLSSLHEKYIRQAIPNECDSDKHKELWAGTEQSKPDYWYDLRESLPLLKYPDFLKVMRKEKPIPCPKTRVDEWIRHYALNNSPNDETTRFLMEMAEEAYRKINRRELAVRESWGKQ